MNLNQRSNQPFPLPPWYCWEAVPAIGWLLVTSFLMIVDFSYVEKIEQGLLGYYLGLLAIAFLVIATLALRLFRVISHTVPLPKGKVILCLVLAAVAMISMLGGYTMTILAPALVEFANVKANQVGL